MACVCGLVRNTNGAFVAGGDLARFANVHLTKRATTSMVASAMEVYPRETSGVLFCRGRAGGRVVIDGLYSIQTEERKWSSVRHGNVSAIRRMIEAISLLDGRSFVGGVHSHPDSDAQLTDDDVEHIQEEIGRFQEAGVEVERWLEIVVSITRRDYAQAKAPGWSAQAYERKLGLTLHTPGRNGTSLVGYRVVAGAYWLFEEAGDIWSREVKVRLAR